MEALILVAENGGPTMFARIGVMRALNRKVERIFDRTARSITGESGSWRGTGKSTVRSRTDRRGAGVFFALRAADFVYSRTDETGNGALYFTGARSKEIGP
jgi:hypothetical protein